MYLVCFRLAFGGRIPHIAFYLAFFTILKSPCYMKLRSTLYVIVCGMLVVGMYMAWNTKDTSIETAQKPAPATKHPLTHAMSQAPEAAAPAKDERLNTKTAVEELKELADSTTPEDSFKRYQILATCFHDAEELKSFDTWAINEDNRQYIAERKPQLEKSRQHCAGVDYAAMIHRFDQLSIAVRANVKGAASAYFYEGPAGDQFALETRPTDPNVLDWKRRTVTQLENAAQNCDQSAVSDLTQVYHSNVMTEKDPAKELLYLSFGYELRRRNVPQSAENYIAKLSTTLSKAKIDEVNSQIKYLMKMCKLHT